MALPLMRGEVYVADDLGEFHLPLRSFYAQQLERGEPFDWMPSLFAGFYVTGEGQLGGYHPLHWLLYRTLPLRIAFGLEVLLSYPILLGGMYVLLKRELSRSAALFGAIVFTFSGFCLLHFVHVNAVAVVAHLPWLLLAIDVALTSPCGQSRSVALLAVGLLTASQLLLGYPQYVWLTWLVAAMFCLWKSGMQRETWPSLVEIALFASLGMLVAAVQLLPTLDALGTSTRATASSDFSHSGSLHPLNLVQLVAPYLLKTRVVGQNTHELGLYIGAAPLLLSVWLLCGRVPSARHRQMAIAAIFLALLGLFLTLGEYGPLQGITNWLPIVNRFRFPCRAIVILHFSLATLAAIALFELLRQPEMYGRASRSLLAVWLCVALACLLALVGPRLWPDFIASRAHLWAGPALLLTAALLICVAERGSRVAIGSLVVFTVLDLGCYGLSYSIFGKTDTLARYAKTAHPLKPGDRIAASPAINGHLDKPVMGNRVLLAGAQRVDGYAGLMPLRALDYTQVDNLRTAATDWLLSSNLEARPLAHTLPRVRLISATSSASGTVQVVAEHPGYWSLRTMTPTSQQLFIAESFHAGWKANIDGRPAHVVRAGGDFMGCEVGAGVHNVELRFQPASLRYGRATSILGVSLLLCSFGIRFARSRTAR